MPFFKLVTRKSQVFSTFWYVKKPLLKVQFRHQTISSVAELQKRADRADQSVLFFLSGANFWEKHVKNRRKHAKTRENRRKTGAFLVIIFLGGKLVGAYFYALCNYAENLVHLNLLYHPPHGLPGPCRPP